MGCGECEPALQGDRGSGHELKTTLLRAQPLSDLQTISLESTGISEFAANQCPRINLTPTGPRTALVLRGGIAGPFLAIPDQSARLWLFKHLERIVTGWNSRRISSDGA